MKVNINANSIQQQIIAEKVKIDQSGNIRHTDVNQAEKELADSTDNKQDAGHEINLTSLKETLKQKIGNGQIEEVFNDLKNAKLSESTENKMLSIAGRYNLLKNDRISGIIDFDEYEIQLSRIVHAVLSLIYEL